MRRYPLALVFESVSRRDYVSEKIWHAFAARGGRANGRAGRWLCTRGVALYRHTAAPKASL